jgi:ribonuclease-3
VVAGVSAVENPDFGVLQERLGLDLAPELLRLALTHRSYAYEHGGIPNNERLEFLGDSVLGQSVTVKLYNDFPTLDEGDLAKRRASLVSTVALAQVGHRIGLGDFLLLGRGEAQSGGRGKASILADTMEAIIGATYLDSGAEAATALVLRLIEPLLADPDRFGASMDPKTGLQEAAAHRGAGLPVYTVTNSGPDHSKVFYATVEVAGIVTGSGEGTSKKQAEMAAALSALNEIDRARTS